MMPQMMMRGGEKTRESGEAGIIGLFECGRSLLRSTLVYASPPTPKIERMIQLALIKQKILFYWVGSFMDDQQ